MSPLETMRAFAIATWIEAEDARDLLLRIQRPNVILVRDTRKRWEAHAYTFGSAIDALRVLGCDGKELDRAETVGFHAITEALEALKTIEREAPRKRRR